MSPEPYVNPPLYTIIMVSCFFAIACGLIFKDMLEYQVNRWARNRDTQANIEYQQPGTVIAYVNLCFFLLIFMGASLAVFGLPLILAVVAGAIVILPTGLLIWLQLGSMLKLLAIGGSEAVSIDGYNQPQDDPTSPVPTSDS